MPADLDHNWRRSVYALLIVTSAAGMVGRILAVNAVDMAGLSRHLQKAGRDDWNKERPFLSANDRSRWCTVRALVEHGTYAIDEIVSQPNWDTIDLVKHDGHGRPAPQAGEGRLYSSKPPLLATLVAAEYWLIHALSGRTLGTHPYEIGRTILVTVNVLPMVLGWLALASLVERFGRTDWGRLFVMAAATWGTFLSTFAVVLNNHLPAAVTAVGTLVCALRIWHDGDRRPWMFASTGLLAALTAANELPAIAFLAAISGLVAWKAPRLTLVAYGPAVALVAAAFFGTNYLAHESLRPPYMHRAGDDNWYDFEYVRDGNVKRSYWAAQGDRSLIDRGEASPAVYAAHVLVGHHGIFLLTPIWLLSLAGLAMALARRGHALRPWASLVLVLSVVCVGYYLNQIQENRNYGGMSSGFRWVFWFTPLWLVVMLPAADALAGRRWSRGVGLALLGLSVMSAAYPTWNPWTHPWAMKLWETWFPPG